MILNWQNQTVCLAYVQSYNSYICTKLCYCGNSLTTRSKKYIQNLRLKIRYLIKLEPQTSFTFALLYCKVLTKITTSVVIQILTSLLFRTCFIQIDEQLREKE